MAGLEEVPGAMEPEEESEEDDEFEGSHKEGQTIDIQVDSLRGVLSKHVTHTGAGTAKPTKRDEANVHYTIRNPSDGAVLQSSLASEGGEGLPAVISVGACEISRAIDEAVPTMRKGERAVLTCSVSLAQTGEQAQPEALSGTKEENKREIYVELLYWHTVKDICGDGGVIMKVREEGIGFGKPRGMDVVTMYITAKSIKSGKMLGTSELGENTTFAVSDMKCEGLKACVQSMHKHEVVDAILRRLPGESGGTDYVAGLAHDVAEDDDEVAVHARLEQWQKVDYVDGTNEQVIKRIVQEGSGFEKPNDGSKATVAFTMRLTHSQQTIYTEDVLEFTVDEDQVIFGLDRAVTAMKKGERAVLTIQPEYAFGAEDTVLSNGSEVPGNSVVQVDVELQSFTKEQESYLLNDSEKIQKAQAKKDDGNTRLQNGKLVKARKRYSQANNLLDAGTFDGELRRESRQLKLQCCLNDALASLKLRQARDALASCNKALEIESANLKGLYRRAQAQYQLGDLDEADVDLKTLLEYDPNNTSAINERRRIKREYKNASGANYGKMFSRKARLYDSQSQPSKQAANDVGDGSSQHESAPQN